MLDKSKLIFEKLIEAGPSAKLRLDQHGSGRSMWLSKLDGVKGFCVWCDSKLPPRKQRWCSDACVTSAQTLCHPQDPASKMYRLIYLQNCACAGCGQSFEDQIAKKIEEKFEWINRVGSLFGGRKRETDPIRGVSLHSLGYGTGDLWQTDHIVPIHKGGKGIDPANLQVLCVPCHKSKTKYDR